MKKNDTLIPAICPQCGAKIELAKNLQKGYCSFCGTEILIKDIVKNVNIVNQPPANNYIILGDRAFESYDYDGALKHYISALEIEPNNRHAIYREGLCKSISSNYEEFNLAPAIIGFKRTVELLNEDTISPEEYAQESISLFMEYFELFSRYFNMCIKKMNGGSSYAEEDMVNKLMLLKTFLCDMIYPILNDGIITLQPTLPTGEQTIEKKIEIMEQIIVMDTVICKFNIDEETRKNCIEEYQQFVEKVHALNPDLQINPINKGKTSLIDKMKGILKKNNQD